MVRARGTSTDHGTETWIAAQAMPGLGAALRSTGRLDEAQGVLDRAVDVARRLGMPRVVAEALEQQAHLAAFDDPDRAIGLHHQALTERVERGLRTFYVDSLDALATLGAGPARKPSGCSPPAIEPAPPWPIRGIPSNAWPATRRLTACRLRWGTARSRRRGPKAPPHPRRSRRLRPSRPREPPPADDRLGQPHPHRAGVVRRSSMDLSNPDIGSRLFMSRGTVKTPCHVYAKLGVTTGQNSPPSPPPTSREVTTPPAARSSTET